MYALEGGSGQKRIGVYGGGVKHKKYIHKKKENIGTKTRLLFVLWKTESKISNLLYLEIYLNLMLKYTGITRIK